MSLEGHGRGHKARHTASTTNATAGRAGRSGVLETPQENSRTANFDVQRLQPVAP
jgi:hypothetical protein